MSALTTKQAKKITIKGPQMVRGRGVMNAINALVYLPEQFQLVFAGNPKDQSFYSEIVTLVEHYALTDRVRFMYEVEKPYITVSEDSEDSPEGVASAILAASRAQA